jgi:hypothetical protein
MHVEETSSCFHRDGKRRGSIVWRSERLLPSYRVGYNPTLNFVIIVQTDSFGLVSHAHWWNESAGGTLLWRKTYDLPSTMTVVRVRASR